MTAVASGCLVLPAGRPTPRCARASAGEFGERVHQRSRHGQRLRPSAGRLRAAAWGITATPAAASVSVPADESDASGCT
jgi:hypothetical protein